VQFSGGLEVFGDQGGVFVDQIRLALFDRRGQSPVQFCAVRPQLRFVGHGTNQRMPEHIFDLRGEPDLVDQLTSHQLVGDRVNSQRVQQLGAEPRPDDCRGIQCALGRRAEPVDAGRDDGLQRRRHRCVGDISV
jgi:hypothetical protein